MDIIFRLVLLQQSTIPNLKTILRRTWMTVKRRLTLSPQERYINIYYEVSFAEGCSTSWPFGYMMIPGPRFGPNAWESVTLRNTVLKLESSSNLGSYLQCLSPTSFRPPDIGKTRSRSCPLADSTHQQKIVILANSASGWWLGRGGDSASTGAIERSTIKKWESAFRGR